MEQLTVEDVVNIHERLVVDAAASDDPISPPGIKDSGLLESAVARQSAGYGGMLKYDNPILNAASLCYGICCNHPLHNGNKRTALVALLCHLDKNNYTFTDRADQDSLYSFMIKVAGHSLPIRSNKRSRKTHDKSDLEVKSMETWIRKRTRRIDKKERTISYPEFEKILRQHNVFFKNHKNNYVDVVVRRRVKVKAWFREKEEEVEEKVANIPFWPNRTVGKNLIKSVRKKAGLAHEHGIDSGLFYGKERTPDDFILRYKKTLYKLAKT